VDRLDLKLALGALLALACGASARAQSGVALSENLCTADSLGVTRGAKSLIEGQRSATLTWTDSANPDWYNVYRGSNGGPYTRIASCLPQPSYVDYGVASGQDVFYVVTAVRSGVESLDSNQGEGQIPVFDLTGAIPNQQGLPTTALTTSDSISVRKTFARAAAESLSSSSSITLTVDAPHSSNASISLSTSDALSLAQVLGRTLADSVATSDAIAALKATTAPSGMFLGAPFRLSLTATALPSQVSLVWTQSPSRNLTGSNVYRHAAQGGPYSLLQSFPAPITYFTDFGVAGGQRYCYVVTATAPSGLESPYSNEACSTPPGGVAAPYRLAVTIRQGRPLLTWTQSSTRGLTGSKVYRSRVEGGPYTLIQSFSRALAYFTDAGAAPGQTYFYVVAAVSGASQSGYSNEVTTTVPTVP